jgi:hypothetical protein
MRRLRINTVTPAINRKRGEVAQSRTTLLVLVCFILGLAIGAFWYQRATNRRSTDVVPAGVKLTEGTKAVLKALGSQVEIRFYSLLDPATTSNSLQTFARRVDQLLSEYEREADGKIKVTRFLTQSDSAATAALSDGIKVFNLNLGDACFLGMAIACNDRRETLAQLSLEWEAALESDVSRAITRVAAPGAQAVPTTAPTETDAATIQGVKRSIPNFASVSVEEGTQILRQAALEDLKAVAKEMETQVKAAQQRLTEAQNSKSAAEQQDAIKELQNVQARQTEKLKEIAARLQDQIAALQKLKKE